MSSKIVQKVRVPRIRPPEPSPKDQEAWQHFLALAQELQGDGTELVPMVRSELERLANKGNPLAIRLQQRLKAGSFHLRGPNEKPLPPPAPRRISHIRWGVPAKPAKSN